MNKLKKAQRQSGYIKAPRYWRRINGLQKQIINHTTHCQFSSGKIYHADLNATYNIGARYFLRELRKSTFEREWLSVETKVLSLARRTQQTLASLISFHQAMSRLVGKARGNHI